MKNKLFLSGICGLLLALCSCGDSPDSPDYPGKQGKVDDTFLNLSRGTDSKTFFLRSHKAFKNDSGTDDGWEEINIDWESLFPEEITFIDGNAVIYYPYFFRSSLMALDYSWLAYCQMTGYDKVPTVISPVSYDKTSNKAIVNGIECQLIQGLPYNLTFSVDHKLMDKFDDGVIIRDIYEFRNNTAGLYVYNSDRVLVFDTKREIFSYVIEMIRAEFGTEFNLKDYLDQDIIFEEDLMVNLDDIKSRLLGE